MSFAMPKKFYLETQFLLSLLSAMTSIIPGTEDDCLAAHEG